jgi:hypothetical protein
MGPRQHARREWRVVAVSVSAGKVAQREPRRAAFQTSPQLSQRQ